MMNWGLFRNSFLSSMSSESRYYEPRPNKNSNHREPPIIPPQVEAMYRRERVYFQILEEERRRWLYVLGDALNDMLIENPLYVDMREIFENYMSYYRSIIPKEIAMILNGYRLALYDLSEIPEELYYQINDEVAQMISEEIRCMKIYAEQIALSYKKK